MTILQYVQNRTIRLNATYHFRLHGLSTWVVSGEELSEDEMNERYPVDVISLRKIKSYEKADKKHLFIYNNKSY